MPKTVLPYTDTTPSGAKWDETLNVELFDDGHVVITDNELLVEDGLFCYLYKPQVEGLLKFLLENR